MASIAPDRPLDASAIRGCKREVIAAEFARVPFWPEFSSAELHLRHGSSLRARISEINRSPKYSFTIRNITVVRDGREVSVYFAIPRAVGEDQVLTKREARARLRAVASEMGALLCD